MGEERSDKPVYTYYVKVNTTDHMLYASEIASYIYNNLGWSTITSTPPVKFVKVFMDIIQKNTNNAEVYYQNKFGLSRVYRYEEIVAIKNYLESLDSKNKTKTRLQDSNGKFYTIIKRTDISE